MEGIYLDNNATTRVDEAVVEAMLPYFTEQFGNPSSMHQFGNKVGHALKTARKQVQDLLCAAHDSEIIFTSCGTESDSTRDPLCPQGPTDPARDHHDQRRASRHSGPLREPRERWLHRSLPQGGHERVASISANTKNCCPTRWRLSPSCGPTMKPARFSPSRKMAQMAYDAGVMFSHRCRTGSGQTSD